jgi:hypothetical protein
MNTLKELVALFVRRFGFDETRRTSSCSLGRGRAQRLSDDEVDVPSSPKLVGRLYRDDAGDRVRQKVWSRMAMMRAENSRVQVSQTRPRARMCPIQFRSTPR